LTLVLLLLGAHAVRALLRIIHGRMAAVIGAGMVFDFRRDAYTNLQQLSLSFYDKRQVGALMSRVTHDTEGVQRFIVDGIQYIFMNVLTLLLVAGIMFWYNPKLAALALATTPAVAYFSRLFIKRLIVLIHRWFDYRSRFHALVNDALSGIRVVKAFAREDEEVERYQHRNRSLCDATMISRDVFDKAKSLAHSETGLPTDHMLMAATHTHSAVRAVGLNRGEMDLEYLDFLARRIADCIKQAINNLAPAKIGYGVGNKPEYLQNRRWFLKPDAIPPNPFGQRTDQVKMGGYLNKENRIKPAGPVDPAVPVLSVQHADGRPLAVLANYGLHYVGGFVRQEISADYFGYFAKRIAELLGANDNHPPFVGIMSNGTSGDVRGQRWPKQPPYTNMREIGYSLADEVLAVCEKIEHRDRISLAMRETCAVHWSEKPSL